MAEIEGEMGLAPAQSRLRFVQRDLASLHATKAAAEEFAQREENVLINNSGRLYDYVVTMDGLDQTVEVKWVLIHSCRPFREQSALGTREGGRVHAGATSAAQVQPGSDVRVVALPIFDFLSQPPFVPQVGVPVLPPR